MYFQWAKLMHAIPQTWENKIKQNSAKNESNFLVLNHHLIKNARTLILVKRTKKEIFSILILSLKNKPTSQNYFESLFPNYIIDWRQVCMLSRIITINSYQRNFQCKILHNMLYLNKKLYTFGKIDSPLCSICHSNDESVIHLSCEYVRVSQLWSQLRIFFAADIDLPLLSPQTVIFDLLAETDKCIFQNHEPSTFNIKNAYI